MNWGPEDFIAAAVLVFAVAVPAVLVFRTRKTGWPYRIASMVALAGAFMLVWTSLAVGIIGSEGHPANLMFAGVLAVALGGALIARFRPEGMARAMFAAALAQAGAGAVALIAGFGREAAAWPWDVAGATGVFTLLWLAAAALFRKAAR
ncbi:MAG: hypothetical protein R3C13_11520 [Hyphomonas sp.]|uniref:hypothetical protein n=1 Tax=Hyphomonas sp. TaxID=87 RepID=UPI003527FC1F